MARKEYPEAARQKRQANRELVTRALVDKKFRTLLKRSPQRAIGKRGRLSAVEQREVDLVLAAVKGIERQIVSIGDELLCVTGPPCGIA